ncbi:hypothetical protein Patl1_16620 [Pistacia atlantica]|uniref:Uncharacterized protein n=1 Tax=Pistacia atlantica TaxID=434234 RepID=A0ACC1B9C7_9ROSI|nr:hypothetical protein Patl1_16620 [Pistacia atlantica]
MAPLRLTCFLFILLFTTSSFSNISAHAHHQDGDAAVEVDAVSKGKGVVDGEITSTDANDQRLGGRRMGSAFQVRKAKKVKVSGVSGETSQFAAGGVEDQRKKMSNVACKQRVGHQFSKEGDQKEFVAFNADYRAPRHHPPKNN